MVLYIAWSYHKKKSDPAVFAETVFFFFCLIEVKFQLSQRHNVSWQEFKVGLSPSKKILFYLLH